MLEQAVYVNQGRKYKYYFKYHHHKKILSFQSNIM